MKLAPWFSTVAVALLGGCVEPPADEDMPDAEFEAEELAGGYEVIPDGERTFVPADEEDEPASDPDPTPEPGGGRLRLEVVPIEDARCEGDACVYPGVCGYTILAQGLPAVTSDGSTYAYLEATEQELGLGLALATDDDGARSLALTGALDLYEEADPAKCAANEEVRRLRRNVSRANAALAAHRWRSLEAVGVSIQDPLEEDLGWDEVEARLRPVEARLRNGSFVLRVRRIAVLHRESWPAGQYRSLDGVFVDRESGLTLARYEDLSEVCGLGPLQGFGMHRVHIPADAIAEADRRAPNLALAWEEWEGGEG